MTTATMESPITGTFFQTGVLSGRKDALILILGFIHKNRQATRDDIWDFLVRVDTIVKANPTIGIVELSALANETGEVA